MKVKIGTHNSMSYLPPKKWYMYPFRFVAKCQAKSIEEQYEKYNARMFDLRIAFNKKGIPEFRHGVMRYKGDVYSVLDYLNSKQDKIYIRLTLETKKESAFQEDLFVAFCSKAVRDYPYLKFFNGTRKFDWKKLYAFKTKEPQITQLISSMTWKKWDDWYPWLYARFMNKKNIANFNNKGWLLVDFINIQ